MLGIGMIGNLNTHLRNMEMKTLWERKRQAGDYRATGDTTLDQWQQTIGQLSGDGEESGSDEKLQDIHKKLESGGRLTQEERSYLRSRDPQTYSELVREEQEQRAYEQELRRCRTREEAQQLKLSRISTSLSVVRDTEHNPSIPEDKKLEIITREHRRISRVTKSHRQFVTSGEYKKLPTRAEETQAMEEAAERRFLLPDRKALSGDPASSEAHPSRQNQLRTGTAEPESEVSRKVRRARAKAAYSCIPADSQQQDALWSSRA